MRVILLSFALAALFESALPASAKLIETVEGKGVQIYRCTERGSSFEWVFQAPDAVLLDPKTHQQLGTHGAGPTWTWNDGSSLKGRVFKTTPSADPGSIPWLELEGTPDPAHPGVFSRLTQIRRFETHGGKAPVGGCDSAHVGAIVRVPYTANYGFTESPLSVFRTPSPSAPDAQQAAPPAPTGTSAPPPRSPHR